MERKAHHQGSFTVIAGPMFSGKTSKIIALIDAFTRMGHSVLIVKPNLDTRYTTKDEIYTHDHKKAPALVVERTQSAGLLLKKLLQTNADKIIIDEAQFFPARSIKSVIAGLRKHGIDVVAAGALYDYRRMPFGCMFELVGIADEYLELVSICQKCGRLARHSERTAGSTSQVDVGGSDKYIAVCEHCHKVFGKK